MADKVYSSLVDTLNKTFKNPGLVDYFSNKLGIDTQASQKMVNPDTSINESNYNKVMNAITGNIPSETKMQFPEYAPYYGGEPVSSMGGRGITKAPNLTDRQKYAKALGISEDTLNALDENTTAATGFTDAITQGKDLSAFMDKQKAQASVKAITPSPSTVRPAIDKAAPAAQPTTAETAKTAPTAIGTTQATPVATDTTQATPAPQENDFQGRMAATAFGNVLASLGAGMAGYSPASVNQMFQGLYGQLNQRQREKEERDPNSTVSKNYREMIAPYLPKGLNISDKSAFDLKQTLPMMISRLEREEQRAFQASESAKDRAARDRMARVAYGYKKDQKQIERETKVFNDISKEAKDVYDVTDAKDLYNDIREMKSIIARRTPGSLTAGRAKGFFGVGGDFLGLQDPDVIRLNTIREGMINKMVKYSGEAGALAKSDKEGFAKNFPAANSANLNEYLNMMENRMMQRRADIMNRFNKQIQSRNKQFGTDFSPEDFIEEFSFELGQEPTSSEVKYATPKDLGIKK